MDTSQVRVEVATASEVLELESLRQAKCTAQRDGSSVCPEMKTLSHEETAEFLEYLSK